MNWHDHKRSSGRVRRTILLPIAAAALVSACSAFEGDADKGCAVAERWCAECHRIAPDAPSGSRAGHVLPPIDAPSFMAVATRPEVDLAYLGQFVGDLHLPMPIYRLSSDEREAVIRYIVSLKDAEP